VGEFLNHDRGGAIQGFKPELLQFLEGLPANKTREWFQAHDA
jgi:hypothetical protein